VPLHTVRPRSIIGQETTADGVDQPDQDGSDESAADRTDAADDDDHEREDQDVFALPICTVRIGACIMPARPASAAPIPNTKV
jgi:hypothetical protein